MSIWAQVRYLIGKEILLEWRSKYALSGILLYVFATVFLVYMAFIRLEPNTWNALFWIILLFAGTNAVLKSFVQESGNRQLYYYQIAHPIAVLLSKVLYNSGLMMLIGLLVWFGLSVVGGYLVTDAGLFTGAIALGSAGFSIAFTFLSAIAIRTDNNATMMAILSFPVVIPILLLLLKVSSIAFGLTESAGLRGDVTLLLAIDLLLLGLAMVLYPFLWQE